MDQGLVGVVVTKNAVGEWSSKIGNHGGDGNSSTAGLGPAGGGHVRCVLEVLAGRLQDDRRDRRLDVAADVVERPEFAHMRALRSKTRGSFLLTFAADRGRVATDPSDLDDPSDPADIASLFSLAMPWRSAPDGRIGFRAKKDDGGPIIDAV